MEFKLLEISSADEFIELIRCQWESYETPFNGFFQIYCPTVGTGPNARLDSMEESTERQWEWHKDDKTSHWLKVVDIETDQVIGGAQWNVYQDNPYVDGMEPLEPYWWPEGEARAYISMALEQWYAPREQRMKKPHVLLNICFVHPDFRRRGAASLLMDWGLHKADELGLESFIEAAMPAIPLYLKHEFKVMDYSWIDPVVSKPSEEWKRLREKIPPIQWAFMSRAPRVEDNASETDH
ncbi:MAG: hypothetical protein Q9220_006934 [cf. Caloplaca sp. 1 TL-2023]